MFLLFSFTFFAKGQVPPKYNKIDFEEFNVGEQDNDTLFSKGFRFYNMPYEYNLLISDAYGTDNKTLINTIWSSTIYMEVDDESLFSLASFVYFGDDPWGSGSNVTATVYGIFSNDDTLSVDYASNQNIAQTLTLNWTNLKRVIIDFRKGSTQNNGPVDDFIAKIGPSEVHTLTVNNGSGSGEYEEGIIVNIDSDTPPEGHYFDTWTGDVDYVSNTYSPNTTVTMASNDISVTATYAEGEVLGDTTHVFIGSHENHIFIRDFVGELGSSELSFTAISKDTNFVKILEIDYSDGDNIAILRIEENGVVGETFLIVSVSNGNDTKSFVVPVAVSNYNYQGVEFQIHDVVFWQQVLPLTSIPVYDTIIKTSEGPWDKLDPDKIPITVDEDCTGENCTGFDFFTVLYKGIFIPPTSGDYTFYVKSQDHKGFWFSEDDNFDNVVNIIHSGQNIGENIGDNQWKSVPQTLQAGKPYAFYATQWIIHTKMGGILMEGPGIAKDYIPGEYMMPIYDTIKPSVVTNLKAILRTSDKIRIGWNEAADNLKVTGYQVYVNGLLFNNDLITGLTTELPGLTPDTKYSIVVIAVDQLENKSLSSAILNVSTYPTDSIPPTPPVSFETLVSTGVSSKLTWSGAIDNETAVIGYNIYIDGELYNTDDYLYKDTVIVHGLYPLTEYSVNIEAIDASYNKSELSETYNFSTTKFDPFGPNLGDKIGIVKVDMENIATSEGFGINIPWESGDIPNNDTLKQLVIDFKPGTIRWGGIGANVTSLNGSTGTGKVNTYGKILELANEIGSKFSVVVGVNDDVDYITDMSTFSSFMEYIAGSDQTTWGAVRASEGYSQPFLNNSNGVIVEFGNEVWGGASHFAPIGSNYSYYAQWCRDAANVIKLSPYYDSTKVKLVYSGRNPHPNDSYGLNRKLMNGDTGEVDYLALSGYIGGNLANGPNAPANNTELEYYQNRFAYVQHNLEGLTETMRMMYDETKEIKPFYFYEGNLTSPTYNRRLGQAILITDYFAKSMEYGSLIPSIFQLTGGEWKIISGSDYSKLPLYYTSQFFNTYCKGDILKTNFLTNENITDPNGNNLALKPIGTYAYSSGESFTVLLLNRDFEHDFTVQLDFPENFNFSTNATKFEITGANFSTLDTQIDTAEIILKEDILVNVPKYGMVVISFTGDDQHFSHYPLGSFEEVFADSIKIVPESDSIIIENEQRIYFNAITYPSNTLIHDVTWEAVKTAPDTMTYKIGKTITGKFYVKGAGECSGNGVLTIRAMNTRKPSVYADYDVKISNQGEDCPPGGIITTGDISKPWVYPNPANSSITIRNPFDSSGKLTVYNLAGKAVINEQLDKTLTLDINSLIQGVYFVKLSVNNDLIYDKIVINR